ncbi:Vacuolar protein sorting-associated protein 27 [Zancudomyces culisetae]|uniref:Vacuolar protein sorting-associated protein 27 n=1 Tax=Zancudomyces culisetae TaxID=1213189 RepID=A0A1R1PRK3_ZANCU|nr:Vacuolar protein sorting-associated protein 27 [Zancudomyces culisetae]|eukprot:OMH83512.1 Vacuolar protein sorting-associated protein 27 [Zancudomyces culisetae]
MGRQRLLNCGKCYCNDCANNYIALPKFGINDQVRVCHGCYLVLTNVVREVLNSQPRDVIKSQRDGDKTDKKLSDEDEDLKRAIELSLKDAKGPEVQVVKPKTPEKTTEEQEELDLKAAIEASLRDAKPSYIYNYSSTAVANHENTLKSPLTAYESEFYPKVPGSSGSSGSSISDNFSVLDDFDIDIDTYTPQSKPQQKASDQLLTSSEMDDINLFRTLLSQIQYSGRDIRDNQQMQYLVEEIKKIKGKIRTEIVQNDTKIQEFLKLHDRILSAIKIYDQFLDQRLLPGQTYAYPSLGPTAPASTVPYNNYNPFAPNYQPQTTSFSSNINPNPVTLQPAQPTTHFAEGHQVHPVYPQQRDQQYQQPQQQQQQQQQHIENTNNSITNQFSQPPPSSMGFAAANAPPSTSKDANISANSYHVQPQLTMDNQAPAETQNYPPPSYPHLQPQPQLQPQPHYPPINPAPEIKPMAPTYIQDQGKTPPSKDDSASVEEGDLIQF